MLKKFTIIAACLVFVLFSGCASQDKQVKNDNGDIANLKVQNKKLFSENQKLKKSNRDLKARLNNEKPAGEQNDGKTLKTSGSADGLSRPYSILLSSCQKQESVQKVISKYQGSDLDPFVVKVDLGEKGVWWRIFSGHFKTREAAVGAKHNRGLADKTVIKLTHADLMQARGNHGERYYEDSSLVKEALTLFE
jgi:regulator of replication initiation timing